ncbi:unnamed protein product [Echinostoma caproni]|uniref:Uncharacterized protein n=1 Tax=Echinostoma caproni TaxID=27848 RepID=A0A3P8D366_9TREM|nr:unnamed protein product [Echinostoma caproni]
MPSLATGTNEEEAERELGLATTGSDERGTSQSNTLDYVTTLPLDGFAHIRKCVHLGFCSCTFLVIFINMNNFTVYPNNDNVVFPSRYTRSLFVTGGD